MPQKKAPASAVLVTLAALMAMCCGLPSMLIGPDKPKRGASGPTQIRADRPSIAPPAVVTSPPSPTPVADNLEPTERSDSPEGAEEGASTVMHTSQGPFNTVAIGSTTTTGEAVMRLWTSAGGTFTTTAELIAVKRNHVLLKKQGGDKVSVSLKKLSRDDYEYVCSVLRTRHGTTIAIGTVSAQVMPEELTFEDVFGNVYTVNLAGVELPSSATEEAADLYHLFSNKVLRKSGWMEYDSRDKQGRVLAQIFIDGRNVNIELVAEGIAWYHQDEAENLRIANAEYVAQHGSKGLWARGLERPEH